MKFYCTQCKKVFNRDMRFNANKNFLTKKGYYKSLCTKTGKDVLMIPVIDIPKKS